MITIRDEQLAAFTRDRAASLPRRVAAYLVETQPVKAAALGRASLEEGVRASLERARALGLTVEWDACRFCLLALLHGPRFDELPWAHDILSDAASLPTERVDQLESYHLNHLA